jgi:hypothetical protein
MASKLSWRDAWLLPLISLSTVLCMLVLAEVGARTFWPAREQNSCVVHDHSILSFHYKPNCISRMKAAEGPWYTNTYNECGYRSSASCAPVAPGVRRIALIGASISEGYFVEYPHTVGAKLSDDLTAMCHAPVEVQNLAAKGYIGRRVVARMAEALRLHPQAVVYLHTPYEVELQLDNPELSVPDDSRPAAAPPPAPAAKPKSAGGEGLRQRVSDIMRESRAVTVAQHFMFRDPSFYLPVYLTFGDKADFLRPPFTPPWRERLSRFERLIAALSAQAHAANTPLILVFVPHQAEVQMEASGYRSKGVDPQALSRAIEAIAQRHGATFMDSSTALEKQPDPADLFYRVDGHPSGKGQPVIARYIAEQIAGMGGGPFADCRVPPAPSQLARR